MRRKTIFSYMFKRFGTSLIFLIKGIRRCSNGFPRPFTTLSSTDDRHIWEVLLSVLPICLPDSIEKIADDGTPGTIAL